MYLLEVLYLVCFYLVALVDQSDVLPEITVSLATHRTRGPLFLVHVGQMSLQVCLEVTTVAALCTLEVLQLKISSGLVLAGPDLTWACCWLMWCFRLVNSLKQWGHLANFSSLDFLFTALLFLVGGGGGNSSSSSCWLERGSSTISSAASAANIATGLTDS